MKENLIIIGAGNVGGFISYNMDQFDDYNVLGFLDDDPLKQNKKLYGRKVLGTINSIDDYIKEKPISVVVGIANPFVKKKIISFLEKKKINFPNMISKNSWISKNVEIGKGIIIYPGVSINYETSLHDFVIVNMNCAIGHNCNLSMFCTLAPGVNLGGFTKVGELVDIGIGVSTRQNINIGKNSIIAGQAMIVKDIPSEAKVKGVPGYIYI